MMDLTRTLRPHRRALVLAAQAAIDDTARDGFPDKSQFNRLITICNEATCAEEITNYLRYQTGRRGSPWPLVFADRVIAKIDPPLAQLVRAMGGRDDDPEVHRAKAAAWHLYAVFLARAFTYRDKVDGSDSSKGKRHGKTGR